jgi:hypothetical protein
MKLVLSYILYKLGDVTSYLLKCDSIAEHVYPVYSKLMTWSSNLDEKGKIWKFPEE